MKKQRLKAIEVDWCISNNWFAITIGNNDEPEGELKFSISYTRKKILYEESRGGEKFLTEKEWNWCNKEFYKEVKVEFLCGWCNFALTRTEQASQEMKNKFDWSEVYGLDAKGNIINVNNYLEDFYKKWMADETCPNSRFYEIIDSEWIAKVDPENKWKLNHYLIDGGESYLEFLTDKLNWVD